MNMTIPLISIFTFCAIFFHDHLISKRHPSRNISFFKDVENIIMLFIVLGFVGFFSSVLSLDDWSQIVSEAKFSQIDSLTAIKGITFGAGAHKFLNGKPTTLDEIGSDDTPLEALRIPVWRKFLQWRNA